MVFAARLTQRGHAIHSMDDLLALYEKAYTADTVKRNASLPHPAVQKFSVITVAVVGASRRFLAQDVYKRQVYDLIAEEDIYTGDGTLRGAKDTVVATLTTGEDGTAVSEPQYLGQMCIRDRPTAAPARAFCFSEM